MPRATLERVDALHIGLTQIVLEGGDLSMIAKELSRTLGLGVLVTGDDVRAMGRASAVGALLITREEAVTAVESKYRGDFLRDVFLGRAGGEDYIVEHAAGFGWDLVRPLVVVAAEIDPPPTGE